MKNKLVYSLLSTLLLLVLIPQAEAFTPTSTTVTNSEINHKITTEGSELLLNNKKGKKRFSKIKLKAQKLLAKAAQKLDIDLQDPVRKWLWYGLIALAAAIVFYTVGILLTSGIFFWISYLASLASSVSLIIWLLKYLELV